jgi:hypothetical protein
MVLDDNYWRTFDRAEANMSFFDQCKIPAIPNQLDLWFDFSRATAGMDLYLGDRHLDISNVIDPMSMMQALDGYRFVLDRSLSSPDQLIWQDKAENNEWNQNWIVLCSTNADPIIADISQNLIPISQAWHGAGIWSPELLFASITELIEHIRVEKKPEQLTKPILRYTVIITNFGITPKQVLLALKKMPEFGSLSSKDLLKFRPQLPLTLLKDSLSKTVVDQVSKKLRSCGATVEIITE